LPAALEIAGLVQDPIALYVENLAERIAPVEHGAGRRRLERGGISRQKASTSGTASASGSAAGQAGSPGASGSAA